MKNNLNALNNYLFEELERLNDDETLEKEENLNKEIKRVFQEVLGIKSPSLEQYNGFIENKYINKGEELNKEQIDEEDYCDDPESYHSRWDGILTEFLEELGHKRIAEMYMKAREHFWYS